MSSPATRTASWRPRWTRAQVGIALLLALLLVVAGKLFWVQGLDPTGRAEAAAQSRTQTEVIPAVRGDIRDTNGKVLARTLQRYDITVDQTAQKRERCSVPQISPSSSDKGRQSATAASVERRRRPGRRRRAVEVLLGVE